jgi:hypothetical protein
MFNVLFIDRLDPFSGIGRPLAVSTLGILRRMRRGRRNRCELPEDTALRLPRLASHHRMAQ